MNKRHIIIGASAAAVGAINGIRRIDPQAEIICISAEQEAPYNKCFLADYLAGKKQAEQISIFDSAQQQAKNVQLILNTPITTIDPHNKQIVAQDGTLFSYDSLLIATGSSPWIPPIAGIQDIQGIFTFHTHADAQAIARYCAERAIQKAIIVGAGLSGLECADSLLQRGIAVDMVVRSHVLSSQFDIESADLVAYHARNAGVNFYFNERVSTLVEKEGRVSGVNLDSGQELSAELVVFATGLRPNSQLARDASIAIEQGGIVTNQYMQTSMPFIYAAGDVALVHDQISKKAMLSCLWPDAMLQGLIAGQAMAGQFKPYPGVVPVISSAFFGHKIASYNASTPSPAWHVIRSTGTDFYKIYTEEDRVRAFSLVGSITLLGQLKRALLTNEPFNI